MNIRCLLKFHHITFDCGLYKQNGNICTFVCTGGCKLCGLVVEPEVKEIVLK